MKRVIISLTIVLIALSSSYSQSSEPIIAVKERNCVGELIEIYLPKAWVSTQRESYTEGFVKTYFYADYAQISLICGPNPNQGDWEVLQSCGMNFREISLIGVTIVYANVFNDRKSIFDKAFDKIPID